MTCEHCFNWSILFRSPKATSFESRDHYSKIHMEKDLNEVSVCLGFPLVILVSATKVKEHPC